VQHGSSDYEPKDGKKKNKLFLTSFRVVRVFRGKRFIGLSVLRFFKTDYLMMPVNIDNH